MAARRLFLLDYDGTLTGFTKDPSKAVPDDRLNLLIGKLISDENNQLVIISGRDRNFLQKWFPQTKLTLIAEHGSFIRKKGRWTKRFPAKENPWKDEITGLIQQVTDRTPGSFIEVKEASIVWHYRKTDLWLADLRIKQLIDTLIYPCTRLNLQIMKGNKIIEVKYPGIDKGSAAIGMIKSVPADFLLAAGDDTTDEDMFRVLPESAITVKVGSYSANARYYLHTHDELVNLLESLTKGS